MRSTPDLGEEEYLATIAVTRLLLGPVGARCRRRRTSPTRSRSRGCWRPAWTTGAGSRPVTPDHVNPERPWPEVEDLRRVDGRAGLALTERLTAHPRFVLGALERDEAWIDPRLHPHVRALADPATGLAREDARATGLGGRSRTVAWRRRGRHRTGGPAHRDGRGRPQRRPAQRLRRGVRRLAGGAPQRVDGRRGVPRLDTDVRAALRARRRTTRRGSATTTTSALLTADGADLDAVAALADELRRDAVGDDVTYVVNRNINFTNVCYVGCRFCAFAQRKTDADAYTLSLDEVGKRAAEAQALGATEVCLQGGISPDLNATAYADIVRSVKAAAPGMHVHAFSPMEIATASAKAGMSARAWLEELKDAGLDSIPGTAAEILDDEVRWVLTKGKLPAAPVGRDRRHGARARHPEQQHDDVRPRRPPAPLGRAPAHPARPCRTAPVGSPSSCRCRSSTPTPRSTSPGSPVRGRRCGTTAPCTRWRG